VGLLLLLRHADALLRAPVPQPQLGLVLIRSRCVPPLCCSRAELAELESEPSVAGPSEAPTTFMPQQERIRAPVRRALLTTSVVATLVLLGRVVVVRLAPHLAGLYQAYEAAALARPLATKSATSAVAYFLGDLLSQVSVRSSRPVDRGRVARATFAGAVSHGPQLHYWSIIMDRHINVAGPPWVSLLAKVVLDQTIFSLYLNGAYCFLTESLQGRSLRAIANKIRAAAWPCLSAGWRFWPAAHSLTYSIVPQHLRVLWVDILEVMWVAILATCVSRSGVSSGSTSKEESLSAHPMPA